MKLETEGRVLDHAALIYDYVQPFVTFGQEGRMNRKILQSITAPVGSSILDVGCGTGVLTSLIARENPGIQLKGIDAGSSMIRVADKKRSSESCAFKLALAEQLPFNDSMFHTVVSALFFHHVNRELKVKVLQEILRVLQAGGHLVIADMGVPYTLKGRLTSFLAWKLLRQPEIRENSLGILPALIEEAGFGNLQETGRFSGYITIWEAEKV